MTGRHPAHLLAGCALLAASWGAGGCGTIDPGPPTGPPPGCNAAPYFFVERVWPDYLKPNTCGRADCHDAQSGHGYFRLQAVSEPIGFDPRQPSSTWPDEWRANLVSATRLLNCSDPTSSLLLAVPAGKGQPHPGGVAVADYGASAQLFIEWASAR